MIRADYVMLPKENLVAQPMSNHDSIVLKQNGADLKTEQLNTPGVNEFPSIGEDINDAVPLNEGDSIPDYKRIQQQLPPFYKAPDPGFQSDYLTITHIQLPEEPNSVQTDPRSLEEQNKPQVSSPKIVLVMNLQHKFLKSYWSETKHSGLIEIHLHSSPYIPS